MVTIEIPAEYAYTLLAAVSTFFVGSFLGGRVGMYRKKAKIPYPYEYASYEQIQTAAPAASKAMLQFNKAQRGHQNFVENQASALGAMLIAGLKYPTATGVLGVIWSINRVVYAWGYTLDKEGGKGRYYGSLWMIAHYALFFAAGKAAWDMLG